MTYDDWKARDDTPVPTPLSWCDACEHDECDCDCCNEPMDSERHGDYGHVCGPACEVWSGRPCDRCGEPWDSDSHKAITGDHAYDVGGKGKRKTGGKK